MGGGGDGGVAMDEETRAIEEGLGRSGLWEWSAGAPSPRFIGRGGGV